MAQQPVGTFPQTKVVPASGTAPVTTVRPYADWTPNAPPTYTSPAAGLGKGPANPNGTKTGYTYPAGGTPQPSGYPAGTPTNRPRPGIAGGDPVRPAGAFVPPPSMEFPDSKFAPTAPPAGATQPPRTLPPPSLSVDPGDSKFATPPAPTGIPPVPPPYVPVPPAPTGPTPPAPTGGPATLPPFPATTGMPSEPPPLPATDPRSRPPVVLPPSLPAPGGVLPSTPVTGGAGPAAPANGAALPSRVAQSVSVEAVCPESVVFNTECRYEIVVRNAGNVAVQNVRVEDVIPAGANYVGSDPPGEVNGDRLVWAIGAMENNTEKRIVVKVRPTEEGELRSRATVSYSAAVDVKTKVTRPRIAVAVSCPEVVRVGEEAVFRIKVSNTGTGPAEKMVLEATPSEGLDHHTLDRSKNEIRLRTQLANLPAGKSAEINLPLTAIRSGAQWCQISVNAEGSQEATGKASVNVVEPMLRVAQSGPAKCLVRAEPTYEITLSNPGTAPTDAVTVHAVLPDGFDFIQASDTGTFNATNRMVTWKLQGLSAGGTKAVGLKLRASAAGDVQLRTVATAAPEGQPGAVAPVGGIPARAGRVLEAKAETPIKAEGVAALRFDVAGLENPVEVGKEAIYEIRIVNQGTGACTNVQIMAALADGTTYTSSNGPTAGKVTNQTLVFEPIASLAVKGETVYRVRVRGSQPGDRRFRVQLTCDQVRTPVVKEESTRFYNQ
ncbi:MAG TPA: hypothetical protein VGE74_07775 [Gemmata sp.]